MAGLLVDTNTIIAFVLALAAGFGFGLVGLGIFVTALGTLSGQKPDLL